MRGQIIMSIPTGKSNNNIPTPPNDDGDYVLQCVNGKLVWDKITVGFGTFGDVVTVSETEPENPVDGQIWLKPMGGIKAIE